jgi:mono/diheme cytochrome c family protein
MTRASTIATLSVAAVFGAWLTASNETAAQEPTQLAGDPARGEPLFADAYNCYACHGFDAQSGERRLVPLTYTQQGFITFVQSSPLPQMPAYPDAPAQDLADIYAYIRTITVDAPAVGDLPLLEDILERKKRAAAESAARP